MVPPPLPDRDPTPWDPADPAPAAVRLSPDAVDSARRRRSCRGMETMRDFKDFFFLQFPLLLFSVFFSRLTVGGGLGKNTHGLPVPVTGGGYGKVSYPTTGTGLRVGSSDTDTVELYHDRTRRLPSGSSKRFTSSDARI